MKQGLLFWLLLVVFSANAQLIDNFSDGNFTANPTWSGDDIYYMVNPAGQLQSNGPTGVTTALSLSTPNTLFQNAEWQFFVKVDFNGTNSNQARIYLMSDQADLKSPLNGYFIGIGQDGSADAVRLFRQQGALTTTPTVVIPGIAGRAAKAADNKIRVRVLRDNVGNWTLFSDTTGTGTSYVLEGSALDNTITSTSYFGVLSRYTSANSAYRNKFFYDDFVIQAAPLQLLSASATNATQVLVQFSEPVSLATSQTVGNYFLSGGIGVPTQAVRNATNQSQVLLTFATPMVTGTSYTLTVNNVENQAGTPVAANSTATFTYVAPPVQVQPREVVINELMADESPVVGLPAAEFVELFNTTNAAINLAGFTISDLSTTVTIPSGASSILPAGGFVILVANANVPLFSSFGQVIGLSSLPSLNNASDQITIRNPSGLIIDRVAYTLAWYNDPVKQNGGWTLEQKNPFAQCSGQSNWSASVNPAGGTPGTQNSIFNNTPDTTPPTIVSAVAVSATQIQLTFSEQLDSVQAQAATYAFSPAATVASASAIGPGYSTVLLNLSAPIDSATLYTISIAGVTDCSGNAIATPATVQVALGVTPQPGELIINEILADISPQVGLPSAEFVELYNASSKVLRLGGLAFTDGTSTATLPGIFLLPNQYLIVTSSTNAALYQPFGATAGVASFPTLNDSGDSLVLKTAGDRIIDLVQYTSAWYRDPTKSGGGWTLERINPNLPCSSADNWAASVNPAGGTPGTQNSIYSTAPDQTAPVLQSVQVVSTNTVHLVFSEQLSPASVAAATITLGGGLAVLSRNLVEPGRNMVRLVVSPAIDSSAVYSVSVSGLADCSGNLMQAATLPLALGVTPQPGELIINELLADVSPAVGLPSAEFVELYNTGSRVLRLGGLKLTDGTSTATLPDMVLQPNQYLIVTATNNAPLYQPFGNTAGVASFPSLNDSGDSLVLKTSGELVLDIVQYTSAWYRDPTKSNGGWTLERINPNLPCSGADNWAASAHPSGGTPGTQNSIFSTAPDQTAPVLQSVQVISPTIVHLVFSEQLNPATVAAATITLSAGLSALTTTLLEPGRNTVRLILNTPLDSTTIYTVTVSGISDCVGNQMLPATLSFGIGRLPEFQELLITEFMADPTPVVGLPDTDFVELFNASGHLLSLAGIKLSDPQSTATLPNQVLLPGEYVIVVPTARVSQFTSFGRVIGVSSFPALNVASDVITLRQPNGKLIFSVSYTDDWYKDAEKQKGGWTLEMIDTANPCGGISNWTASVNPVGGTPGQPNSVAAVNPDNTPPVLVRADVLNPTQVQLSFNEPLDSLSAASLSVYGMSHSLSVTEVQVQSPAFTSVVLTFSAALVAGEQYTLTITGLRDCAGNAATVPVAVTLVLPQPAALGDIIINEVLFNPRSGGVDFVELYNLSDKYIDLKDWSLANANNAGQVGTTRLITSLSYVLPPGGYVVLTTNPGIVKQQYPLGREETFLQMSSLPSYPDSEGSVILINQNENIVDRFDYNRNMHYALIDDLNGVSLERIRPQGPSNSASNWQSASSTSGFATPGYRNSQFLGEAGGQAMITVFPKVFTPDSGGDQDFTTIHYQFGSANKLANITVFDSNGREIRKLVRNQTLGTEGFIKWDGTTNDQRKANVGYYVFYIELTDLGGGEVQVFKEPVVVGARF